MSDTFRKEYKKLSYDNSELVIKIKEAAEIIERALHHIGSRESSIALTQLETAVMWATKAVVLNDECNQ